jgi:hypothetical protein
MGNAFTAGTKGATNVHTAGPGPHLQSVYVLSGFEDSIRSNFVVGSQRRDRWEIYGAMLVMREDREESTQLSTACDLLRYQSLV